MKKLLLILVFVMIASAMPIIAQTTFDEDASKGTNNRGQAGFMFLKIPSTARQVALMESSMNGEGSALSMFVNISEIADLSGYSVAYTNQNLYGDLLKLNIMAFTAKISERMAIGFSLKSLQSQEMAVTTIADPDGMRGIKYTFSDIALSAGFGYRVSKRFSIGANVKLVNEEIYRVSANTVLFDVATLYRVQYMNIKIAATMENFGAETRYDGSDLWRSADLTDDQISTSAPDITDVNRRMNLISKEFPAIIKITLAVTGDIMGNGGLFANDDNRISVSCGLVKTNEQFESIGTGLEYSYLGVKNLALSLRGAVKQFRETDYDMRYAVGAGIGYNISEDMNLKLDYAYTPHDDLDQSHIITLGMGF